MLRQIYKDGKHIAVLDLDDITEKEILETVRLLTWLLRDMESNSFREYLIKKLEDLADGEFYGKTKSQ